MSSRLTTEFAAHAELPLSPFARHTEVARILDDASMVEEGIMVRLTNTNVFAKRDILIVDELRNSEVIALRDVSLFFLGRNALKKVAEVVDFLDTARPIRTEGNTI